MAIVNPKDKNRTSRQGDGESTTNLGEGKVVDIFTDKNLPAGKKSKLDATEDAFSLAAPPKEDRYSIKLHLGNPAVKLQHVDKKDPNSDIYYSISLECTMNDPEYRGIRIFATVTTRIGRGKNISTAAGLIVKMGYKIPNEASDLQVAELCAKAIKTEPNLDVDLKWVGESKIAKNSAGYNLTVFPNMASFPTDLETGEPQHIAMYTHRDGTQEEIRANLRVDHWYGKNEKAEASESKDTKSNVTTLKPAMVVDDSDSEKAGESKDEGSTSGSNDDADMELAVLEE